MMEIKIQMENRKQLCSGGFDPDNCPRAEMVCRCPNCYPSSFKAENTTLKKQIQLMHDNGLGESWVEKFTAKTYELQAENAKLRADLEYHGNHDGDCDMANMPGGKCTCGYEKALKDNGCRAATETCGMTREELDGRI